MKYIEKQYPQPSIVRKHSGWLYLLIVLLGLFGLYKNFIVSDAYSLAALSLSIITTLFYLYLYLSAYKKNINDVRAKHPFSKKILIGSPIATMFCSYFGFAWGLPVIISEHFGSQTEVRYEIYKLGPCQMRYSQISSLGGNRAVNISENWWELKSHICGFSKSSLEGVTPGDTLVLIGKGTFMGILPENYRIERR